MKKTIISGIFALVALSSSLHAQLVLSNFSNFTADAEVPFGQNGWETPTQITGQMELTTGTGLGNYVWFFSTPQDYSAYSQVSLDGLILSGNTSSVYTFNIIDSGLNVLASATFTAAELTGVDVLKTLNIISPINAANGWQIAADGSPLSNTRVSFDNVALVPEPSTYALLLVGGVALVALRRNKSAVKA
ncbi:MAG: PEP-CTERM sorting domain-containing protein [Candidatus Methylacidiphilales bacterium]|nr:PEP-CTERM sorting domain-containing protein [Candidatus Methylacidiphilales bacterium]